MASRLLLDPPSAYVAHKQDIIHVDVDVDAGPPDQLHQCGDESINLHIADRRSPQSPVEVLFPNRDFRGDTDRPQGNLWLS